MKTTTYLRYCRVCAKKKDFSLLLPIVGHEQHSDISYKMASLHIQFAVHDQLPQEICHHCLTRVETTYSFIDTCKRAQQKLMQMSFRGVNFQDTIYQAKKDDPEMRKCTSNIIMSNINKNFGEVKGNLITMNVLDEVPSKDLICNTMENVKNKGEEMEEDDPIYIENEENPVETKSKDLVNELLVKEAVKNYPCPHCDKRFQTPSGLRFHKESIHGNSRFVCELCGKDFGHKTYLNIHMKAHLPEAVKKLFNCSTCDKCFPTKYKLKEHLNTHYDLRPHVCSICKKSFHQSSNLRAHLLTHKEMVQTIYYCSQCGDKPFYCRRLLVRHIRRHVKRRSCCRICDANFETRAQLKKHSRDVHTHEDMKKRLLNCEKNIVECTICHQVLSKSSLRRHTKSHDELGEGITCEVCGKRLKSSTSLNYHYRTHHSAQEASWSCQYCEASFMLKELRTRHEYIHTGETPFRCTQCNKGFRSIGSLRQHGLVHRKPSVDHSCSVCHKQFKRKAALHVHMRKHTGDLPFKCRLCNKRYAQKNDRDRHEGAIHWTCSICSFQSTSTAESKVHFAKCSKTGVQNHVESTPPENAESSQLILEVQDSAAPSSQGMSVVQYLCTACNVTFNSEQRLENHFTRYHGQSDVHNSTVEAVHFEYTV